MSSTAKTANKPDLGKMPEWDLSDLYPGRESKEVAADIEKAVRLAGDMKARYQGKLVAMGTDGKALAGAVATYEELSDTVGRLGSYAGLLHAGNVADGEIAKFYGDIQEKLTGVMSEILFFELELNQIADADIEKALASPELSRFRPWFEDLRKEKPYQLDEKLEKLFLEKSQTSAVAFCRLFDETMTALRFKVDGEGEALTLEPTLNLLTNRDGNKRQAAAEALAEVFGANVRLFTQITNTLAKDKEISDRWRGFKDVADSRHLSNSVEGEVVDALVAAVRERYPNISHRYYKMKARWLGQETLPHWDRNAPLPEKPERVFTWDQAEGLIMKAYGGFAPEMADIARTFFDKNWIDAPIRDGKAPGAFSHPTVPSAHPYILMNYQGKPRDVMTLAHELGHGVHQVLAAPQGPLLAQTPLTLAETASVFGEMLTFKALLAETTDPKERKALVAGKVEDMINTVVRQIAFYSFERKVHEARRQGELTSEQIGELWMSVQAESLGPAIDCRPGYEFFWTYIPHFIRSPFYVYAYAFGDCLVNSLYALYADAHPGFVGKYFDMLKAGGSMHHSKLLAPFGLDASKPEFWRMGLSVIEGMIDELEAMEAAGV